MRRPCQLCLDYLSTRALKVADFQIADWAYRATKSCLKIARLSPYTNSTICLPKSKMAPTPLLLFPRLCVGQHASDCSHVSRINESRFAQVSLPFGRLLGQDVALVGLLTADFSTTGNFETLGRSSISLDLRHSSSRILAVPKK